MRGNHKKDLSVSHFGLKGLSCLCFSLAGGVVTPPSDSCSAEESHPGCQQTNKLRMKIRITGSILSFNLFYNLKCFLILFLSCPHFSERICCMKTRQRVYSRASLFIWTVMNYFHYMPVRELRAELALLFSTEGYTQ